MVLSMRSTMAVILIFFTICVMTIYLSVKVISLRNQMNELTEALYAAEQTLSETSAELDECEDSLARLQKRMSKKHTLTLRVTAFQAKRSQTDSTPYTTAFMRNLRKEPLSVAVSRDIVYELGWPIGSKVYIEGIGVRKITDFMNKRYKRRMDVYAPDKAYVKKVGNRKRKVCLMMFNEHKTKHHDTSKNNQ